MTFKEWVVFILFNIAINVFFQTMAWKIASLIEKKKVRKKNEIS